MKIDTATLRSAFEVINQVDTQPGLLSSQFVRLVSKDSELQLALTGLCTAEAQCPITEPGNPWTWYIDRRILEAFLASAPKVITIDQKGDMLLWRSGRQKITTATVTGVTGYAKWVPYASPVKLVVTPEQCKELALHSLYAPMVVAADNLSAVCVQKQYGSFASDTFVISAALTKAVAATAKLPVLLARALSPTSKIQVEKDGVGVTHPNGYLYQSLSTNCVSAYPLRKITDTIDAQIKVSPVLKVKAKAFADMLTHIRGYVFGADDDLEITCTQAKTAGTALASLDVIQGHMQTSMSAEYTKDFEVKWNLAKLQPWVEFICKADANALITCGHDGCYVFTTKIKGTQYLLIITEVV